MKEETMFKIVNEINDALWDLKYNQCNVDTKEKGWETYYGLDDGLIKYIRKIEKELDQYKNNWEELKKYIENFPGISYASSEKVDGERLSGKLIPVTKVLNKMKELEEKNND